MLPPLLLLLGLPKATLSSEKASHILEGKSSSSLCVNCHTSSFWAQSALARRQVQHHVRDTSWKRLKVVPCFGFPSAQPTEVDPMDSFWGWGPTPNHSTLSRYKQIAEISWNGREISGEGQLHIANFPVHKSHYGLDSYYFNIDSFQSPDQCTYPFFPPFFHHQRDLDANATQPSIWHGSFSPAQRTVLFRR